MNEFSECWLLSGWNHIQQGINVWMVIKLLANYIKQKAKYNLTGDNEILRSLHSKRNIKTKTKMFLPICPDQMGRSASTWLRKCDQFSLFQSLSAAEAGPKILKFHVLKKSRVFQRFSKLLLLCDSRQIFGVLSMSLFYYFSQYTWKINING